eukprot:291018-Alexandrium_andersonii.AAC.1
MCIRDRPTNPSSTNPSPGRPLQMSLCLCLASKGNKDDSNTPVATAHTGGNAKHRGTERQELSKREWEVGAQVPRARRRCGER